MSTHHVYSREEVNELRLKKEVYSMLFVDIMFTWASWDSCRQFFQNTPSNAIRRCTFCGASNVDQLNLSDHCEGEPGTPESQRPIAYSKAMCLPRSSSSSVIWRLFRRDLLVFCSVWRFSSARNLFSVLHPVTDREGAGTCGEVTLQCDGWPIQMNDYILAGVDPGLWNKGHIK